MKKIAIFTNKYDRGDIINPETRVDATFWGDVMTPEGKDSLIRALNSLSHLAIQIEDKTKEVAPARPPEVT